MNAQLGELVLQDTSTDDWLLRRQRNPCSRCTVHLVMAAINYSNKNKNLLFTATKCTISFNFYSMNINGWEMMIPLAFFAATG